MCELELMDISNSWEIFSIDMLLYFKSPHAL